MRWDEVVLELVRLSNTPVCVTVGELGGAGAEVATFGGHLSVGEWDPSGSDNAGRLVLRVGNRGGVTLEETLLQGAERREPGVTVGQATLYIDFSPDPYNDDLPF